MPWVPTLEDGEDMNQTPKRKSTKTAAPVTSGLVPCGAPILKPRAAMVLTDGKAYKLGEELRDLGTSCHCNLRNEPR